MPRPNVRENIVESALDQFHRMGFNGCSVDDITRAAGVPKGSFYNHFKGKEDLALEVIRRYANVAPRELLTRKDISPLKRLKKYFGALTELFTDAGYRSGCLLGNFSGELADHSDVVRELVQERLSSWASLLANVIAEAQEAGEITTRLKPDLLAGFLLSAWQGTLLRARAAKDPAILKEFHSVAFGQLLL
jgi:TetR/AcrR family transcriptional repressor of nem operon